jgi:hypothetical protein
MVLYKGVRLSALLVFASTLSKRTLALVRQLPASSDLRVVDDWLATKR